MINQMEVLGKLLNWIWHSKVNLDSEEERQDKDSIRNSLFTDLGKENQMWEVIYEKIGNNRLLQ